MQARERFEETRRSINRLDEVHALIMYECDDWKPPTIRARGEKSDPTANRAAYNVDELAEKLAALRREESELTEFIGVTLAIIAAVRSGFGEIYANVLEWRYVDGWTWKRIHEEHGIKRHVGYYLVNIAFDWVDSIGVSRLLKGQYEI